MAIFFFFSHFLQSDESINYAFRIPGSRKQHVYLSSYQSFPPFTRCQRARRDTNTGRGWVGGRTAELVVMEKISISSFICRGRAPAELGLICVQLSALWGTLEAKFVPPVEARLVNVYTTASCYHFGSMTKRGRKPCRGTRRTLSPRVSRSTDVSQSVNS